MSIRSWGSDGVISQPDGLNDQSLIKVKVGDGWVFTEHGLVHDLTTEDAEESYSPHFLPPGAV